MEASRNEQQHGWGVLTKYQDLSGPSHDGLFQGDRPPGRQGQDCMSAWKFLYLQCSSVSLNLSSPASKFCDWGSSAGLDHEAPQATPLKWGRPLPTLSMCQLVWGMPWLSTECGRPRPAPSSETSEFRGNLQESRFTCLLYFWTIVFLFPIVIHKFAPVEEIPHLTSPS